VAAVPPTRSIFTASRAAQKSAKGNRTGHRVNNHEAIFIKKGGGKISAALWK
jgi:hypothetical protein